MGRRSVADPPASSHPWPTLHAALDTGRGVTLAPAQVRELLADYDAVVKKANHVTQQEYGSDAPPANPDWV